MSERRRTSCDANNEQSPKKSKSVRCFSDLPDEMILLICRYLSPAHILQSFLDCNKRFFCCISNYHQTIDFTKFSCRDFDYYIKLLEINHIRPCKLIFNNARIQTQIKIFFNRVISLTTHDFDNIRHLSLLQCTTDILYSLASDLEKFKYLETLQIVQGNSNGEQFKSLNNYSTLENLICLIFYSSFNKLRKLDLIIGDGLILSKYIPPNPNLQYLNITLRDVNDLYVLLDGLVPNLIVLNVRLCQSDTNKRVLLPKSWPHQSMSYLKEFQLVTKDVAEFTSSQLCNIVKPMIQLNKLTLYIRKWVNDDPLQILFERFPSQLDHFFCSITTINNIDTFSKINERWPIKCRSESDHSQKHFYTVPWSFERLNLSMLADDDIDSICPNVQHLTIDVCSTSTNLSYRFPYIRTLTIQPECHLPHENYLEFRQLRHLTMKTIDVVPSSVIRRLRTLILYDIDGLSTYSMTYSNVKYFILKNSRNNSLETVNNLIKHFPSLRSLEMQLQRQRNDEYYDSLNILLDGEHLPHLLLLKTNWIDDQTWNRKVSLWFTSETSMRWRSTIFCAYCNENDLIICL